MALAHFQLPVKEPRGLNIAIKMSMCCLPRSVNLTKLQAERGGSSGLAPRWKFIKGREKYGEMQAVSEHAGKNASSRPQPGKGATSLHRVQSQPVYNGHGGVMSRHLLFLLFFFFSVSLPPRPVGRQDMEAALAKRCAARWASTHGARVRGFLETLHGSQVKRRALRRGTAAADQ